MERRAALLVTVTRARTTRTMAAQPGAATAIQTPTTHRLPIRAKLEPSFRVSNASSAASTMRAATPLSPSTLNDKEWIAVDSHSGSPFQDRIYVSWTRFIFTAHYGSYVQSPIFFVYSTDGGATFSTPKNISGSAHYSQGSRPVVGPDGTVYVFWNGSTRLASLNSTYMAKSTDGGDTWSPPLS